VARSTSVCTRCWWGTCRWLAADFDGPSAMLDALAYLKAARAVGGPAALEVSRSGIGAHVWIFFAGLVPAATARALGSGLLREAIALRGRMNLTAYDRLFPSQDVLPSSGGIGKLDRCTLQGRSRRHGATVFLDLATLEPHTDRWSYLASLNRLSPREVERLAERVTPPAVGAARPRSCSSLSVLLLKSLLEAAPVTLFGEGGWPRGTGCRLPDAPTCASVIGMARLSGRSSR
jgi:hypothetical protein